LHTIESLLVNLVNKDNVTDISSLTKRERLDSTSIEESSQQQQSQHFNNDKFRQYSPNMTSSKQNLLFIPSSPPSDSLSDGSPNYLSGYANEMTIEDEEILLNNLVDPNLSNTLQSNTLSFLMLDNLDELSDYVEPALPTSIADLKPIPEEISKQLFERYFNHFHPYFPIVNHKHFFHLLNDANVQDQPSKLLIETICTIGAMFPPTVKHNDDYSSQYFYERVKSKLKRFAFTAGLYINMV